MRGDGVFSVVVDCSAMLIIKTDFDNYFWPSLSDETAVIDVYADC